MRNSGPARISSRSFPRTPGTTITFTNSRAITATNRISCHLVRMASRAERDLKPTLSVGKTSNGGRRGITLLEMLVVMCIVGLIIGVTTPSISAGLDSVRLATATSSVAGFLNAAVTRVERRQQPIEVVFLPQENRIVIYSNEPGFTRDLTMPDGVTRSEEHTSELQSP